MKQKATVGQTLQKTHSFQTHKSEMKRFYSTSLAREKTLQIARNKKFQKPQTTGSLSNYSYKTSSYV